MSRQRGGGLSTEALQQLVLLHEQRNEEIQMLIARHAEGSLSCVQFTNRCRRVYEQQRLQPLAEMQQESAVGWQMQTPPPRSALPKHMGVFSPAETSPLQRQSFSQPRINEPQWTFGGEESDSDIEAALDMGVGGASDVGMASAMEEGLDADCTRFEAAALPAAFRNRLKESQDGIEFVD